jgi:hypothetical protein
LPHREARADPEFLCSLSEFGCNTNTRKFEEISALYSTQMTPVYSGGLVYEYSQEDSNYGLVEISGSSVTERPDFTALQSAYSGTPNPSGDGGYKSSGGASQCPSAAPPAWVVKDNNLPNMPDPAKKYLTQGAGAGPGNSGSGSQNAGTATSGTTPIGAAGSSSSSKAAAANVRVPEMSMVPFVAAVAVVVSAALGGAGFLL